jgi:translation initiation factor 2 gamma subunit (eIF-2gamma)
MSWSQSVICYPLFRTFYLYHLFQGTVKKNQQQEIRPGSVSRDKDGQPKCNPIIINVASLDSIRGNVQLEQAVAGDMIF